MTENLAPVAASVAIVQLIQYHADHRYGLSRSVTIFRY